MHFVAMADFIQISAGLIVLISLAALFIFLLKISVQDANARTWSPSDSLPALAMGQVHNPFTLNIQNPKTASIKNGVSLRLTTQLPCQMTVLWGVDIKYLHSVMSQSWNTLLEKLLFATGKSDLADYHSQPMIYDVGQDVAVYLIPPPHVHFDFGQPPRFKYPLVVILVDTDAAATNTSAVDDHIAIDVNILHLQDDICTGPSQLLAHYVRTRSGKPHNLRQVYLSSDDSEQSEAAPQGEPPGSSCVICQLNRVDRVLLPCRHACVCDGCFLRVQQCPMCRELIQSFFFLDLNPDNWYRNT